MKYLKEFSSESDYLDYRYGNEFTNPNVSLCEEKGGLYYNFTPPPITYDYVDLGLPSGTKWATKNVGARKPSDAGFYFQWGDTKGYTANQVGTGDGKKKFADDWSDYKWGADPNFTKYTFKTTLDLEDDAAHVNWGGDWHMPSGVQIQELIDNTTTTWTTQDGVSGMTFISTKDTSKSLFIPAAGRAVDGLVKDSEGEFHVWASTVKSGFFTDCQSLSFFSSFPLLWEENRRSFGYSIRGISKTGGNTNGHSYVDFGLPSGTLWATMNVGASKPSDYGLYFQWGDTQGYTKEQVGKDKQFTYTDYKWYLSGNGEESILEYTKYTADTLVLKDDAAHVYMGSNWHIPTMEHILELIMATDNKFTTLDGVSGITFTSNKDDTKSIFIPARGGALNGSVIKSGEGVAIWLDKLESNDSGSIIGLDNSGNNITELQRYYGLPIRGVMNA